MFGERLKDLRESHSMKQGDLADYLNVSRQSIGGYENGTTLPPVDILVKIADKFNVTCDYLLGRTDEKYNFSPIDTEHMIILERLYEDKDIILKLYENKDVLLKIYEAVELYASIKK